MLRLNQTTAIAEKVAQMFETKLNTSQSPRLESEFGNLSKGRTCEPLGELTKARRRRLRRSRALVQP